MNFDGVEKIAAAILYEGYILYPYRPSAIKNRQRWNFGTLYPRVYAEAQRPQESFRMMAECLLEADPNATLDVRLSYLQLVGQDASRRSPLTDPSLTLTDPSLTWEEAVEHTSDHPSIPLSGLLAAPLVTGREAKLSMAAQMVQGNACKLRLEIENLTPLPSGGKAKRDEALARSFVSAHLLLRVAGGAWISLLDPGDAYREVAAGCRQVGVFPVLAGEEPDRSMMLCSPIILYDYPKVAPESAGDFFDGTEMDEMLTLRVLTLTEEEKQQMRADPRARTILERTEALTAQERLQAHGVIRGLRRLSEDAP